MVNSPVSGTNPLLVYLSGNVRKGSGDERSVDSFWSAQDEQRIAAGVRNADVLVLNPERPPIQRSNYRANFGSDLHWVRISDAILVDLRAARGIGTGAEMMFARFCGTPVISVCPPRSFYRQELVTDVFGEDLHDWVHPFVAGLSDHIAADLDEAIGHLNELVDLGRPRRTDPGIEQAIAYFHRTREIAERG